MNEMERIELKSFKQLWALVPPIMQTPIIRKGLRRRFSKAMRMESNCYIGKPSERVHLYAEKNYVAVEIDLSDHLKVSGGFEIPTQNPLRYQSGYARGDFEMDQVLFKKTGFFLKINSRLKRNYTSLLTKDGELIGGYYYPYKNIPTNKDVVGHGNVEYLTREIRNKNPDCFKELTYQQAHSYAVSVCVKDIGPFKRGMIIDWTSDAISYKYFLYDPRERFGQRYWTWYRVSCDLNKITRQQLEAISVNNFSCNKRQFGCGHGCTDACYADNANGMDAQLKSVFLGIMDELGM